MIDLGLVDPADRVGFELDPALYHRLKQAGQLSAYRRRSRRDASGRLSWTDSGATRAQLVSPATGQVVGPVVPVHASCGSPGVPNRAGVTFFHRLQGCRVLWDLGRRTWCVEYP